MLASFSGFNCIHDDMASVNDSGGCNAEDSIGSKRKKSQHTPMPSGSNGVMFVVSRVTDSGDPVTEYYHFSGSDKMALLMEGIAKLTESDRRYWEGSAQEWHPRDFFIPIEKLKYVQKAPEESAISGDNEGLGSQELATFADDCIQKAMDYGVSSVRVAMDGIAAGGGTNPDPSMGLDWVYVKFRLIGFDGF